VTTPSLPAPPAVETPPLPAAPTLSPPPVSPPTGPQLP
jgi:hypothetical protein